MKCGKKHLELDCGTGYCSVPMWLDGIPAGFCDEDAYGKPVDPHLYVPGLACPGHGGPKAQEVLNLCSYCTHDFGSCKGKPKFGCGKGNDNVYECGMFRGGEKCGYPDNPCFECES